MAQYLLSVQMVEGEGAPTPPTAPSMNYRRMSAWPARRSVRHACAPTLRHEAAIQVFAAIDNIGR